jgi:hypothetical protein
MAGGVLVCHSVCVTVCGSLGLIGIHRTEATDAADHPTVQRTTKTSDPQC